MTEGYLTFCEGVISSTGKPVIKKNTSNTYNFLIKLTSSEQSGGLWVAFVFIYFWDLICWQSEIEINKKESQ